MLVFNTAILAAASAIASRPGRSAALVFLLGAVACALSYFVMRYLLLAAVAVADAIGAGIIAVR